MFYLIIDKRMHELLLFSQIENSRYAFEYILNVEIANFKKWKNFEGKVEIYTEVELDSIEIFVGILKAVLKHVTETIRFSAISKTVCSAISTSASASRPSGVNAASDILFAAPMS